MAKIDIKQHVTDTIISEIAKGTPPWRKPWTGDATGAALPLRHDGTAYRGVNGRPLAILDGMDGKRSFSARA